MNLTNNIPLHSYSELRRVRLSEWARMQGISRLTAYRMLKRGILPVPSERSPTGRWYVLLHRANMRTAIYTRATQGPHQIEIINSQVASLSEWATTCQRTVFTVAREIADPATDPMPRLERLLADRQITEIVIDTPSIIGICQLQLLKASLASQGRTITAVNSEHQWDQHRQDDWQASLIRLCKLIHGPQAGGEAAHQAITYPGNNQARKRV